MPADDAPGTNREPVIEEQDASERDDGQQGGKRRRRPWLKPLVLFVLSIAVAWIVVGFVGSIDWSEVVASFGRLTILAIVVLVLGLLVRQAFNAVPLSRFVVGLPWWRSVQNDQAANVVGTFAPPPADVVLRVSMFSSWGINPVDGMAGVTLNMFTFYAVRFLAPVLGVLVLLTNQGVERGQIVSAVVSGLVAAAVIGGLVAVMRGDVLAAWVGRSAARVVNRVREGADEQEWALAVVDFRGRMNQTLRAGLVPSLAALVAMVLTDAAILLMALRFVGVSASELPVVDIVGGFLIAYPLTLMPLAGLGVLDAALLAAFTEIAGLQWEAEIVAALVVWRTITLGGPLLMGAIIVSLWRRDIAHDAPA